MQIKGKVLLVDDDIMIHELWRALLADTGIQLECLADSESVEDHVSRFGPGLLVLDYLMPGRNGIQVLESLQDQQQAAFLPVWMVTTESQSELVAKAYKLGVADYLVKPINAAAVREKVVAHFARLNSMPASLPTSTNLGRSRANVEALLRDIPAIEGLDVGLIYEPHDEVGGDFYDFIHRPDGTWLVVLGDISGHGVEAALLQTMTRKLIQLHLIYGSDVTTALQHINADIRQDFPKGQFCAAVVIEYSGPEHDVRIFRFGVPHPIIRGKARGHAGHEVMLGGGALFGVFPDRAFSAMLNSSSLRLLPDEALLLHSDGAVESRLAGGNEMGFERLGRHFSDASGDSGQAIADDLLRRIREDAGEGIDDDLTALVLLSR